MPLFIIDAIDNKGNRLKKVLNIEEEALFTYLDFANLTPIKIRQLPSFFRFLSIKAVSRKVKRSEIIEVLESLHLIVKSGIPLSTGIIDLAEDAQNPVLKDILYDIAFKIQSGLSLSNAVQKYRKYFSDIVITLFQIGEETGTLDQTLKDAADHLKRVDDITSKTKQALIYPAFAITAIFGAIIFWTVYVLPKLVNMFKGMGIELPFITEAFMSVSNFLIKYGIFILAGFILVVILIKVLKDRNDKVKLFFDRLLLKTPIIGLVLNNFYYAFFSEYLRLMIKAGIPINRALEILSESLRNFVFKKAIKNTKEKIEEGYSLTNALSEVKLFPPLIVRMISVGETTGGLEEQLEYIANYYYNKVDYISQNIAKMIEPIVIAIIGAFLLVVIFSIISPIYDLIVKLSG